VIYLLAAARTFPLSTDRNVTADYGYSHGGAAWDDRDLWDVVRSELAAAPRGCRIFELGCGNGLLAARIAALDMK
jgi:hypothetical protein